MKAFGQRKPKTLTALILHLLSTATFSLLLLWVFTIVSTRVYIFHNAYIHHLQTVEDELWIREQCKDPEFYAHLAAHSVLCQNVFENARKNTLLVALNETVSTASACGTVGCWELLAFVQSGGLSLVATVSIVLLAVVTVVFPSLNIISKWLRERDAWSWDHENTPAVMAPVREHDHWLLHAGKSWDGFYEAKNQKQKTW